MFLIGFPITTSKPLIGFGLNLSWESGKANKLCTLYLPSKPKISPSAITMVKYHKKKLKLFSCDYLTTDFSILKYRQKVNFEEINFDYCS